MQKTKANTAVVILNWNGQKHLKQFLPSVVQHSSVADVVVIDNGSTDESLAYLAQYFPSVQCISLPQNYGFAAGYNKGLEQLAGAYEYFMLLNSDVEVTPNWLAPLVALLDENMEIGAVQPKIRAFDKPTHFEYAGAAGGYLDRWGYPFCRGRVLSTLEEDKGQYDVAQEVFWASGAALMIRAELYRELNGFDDDFFAHMEEIDLCWRIQRKGMQVYCQPQSEVLHLGGGTLSNESPFKLYLNFRNSLYMLYKNEAGQRLFLTLFIRMILDGIAALNYLACLKGQNFLAVVRAHFSFYKHLPKLIQKRKANKTPYFRLSQGKNVLPKSLLWSYFAKGEKVYSSLMKKKV